MERRTFLIRATAVAAGLALPLRALASPSDRVAALIARMTIAEKAGQLSCFNDEVRPVGAVFNPVVDPRGREAMLAEVAAGRVGMLFNGYGVAGARSAQDAALSARLRIPLLFAADVIHGCRTIFPIPLAEAAAFDPDLSRRAARGVAREATAGGLHWTFAPVVDVARDQRWGRVAEGAGEDVLLNRLLAAARVQGFQGPNLSAADSLIATPKHFAAYGAVRGGMEYGPVDISEEELETIHLPPFAAAFAAGAASTLASFTEVNGVPASASKRLLTDRLRGAMGFAGPCVSDYDADRELIAHGVARDEADAARLAILAGIDISMQSGLFNRHLPALVESGAVPMTRVDEAVARVLTLKEKAGLFDDPYRSLDARAERTRTRTPALRRLARETAQRSIVLLRNEGELLPLGRSGRIALIGPFASGTKDNNGPWSFAGDTREGVALDTAIRDRIGNAGSLVVEPGCTVDAAIDGGVDRAIAAARTADVVLLAIGEDASMSGEGNSRADIGIPAAQQALVEAIARTGKPVVILLRHGRALALDGAAADARAILATWFLGDTTGDAVADILFGIVEPTGRLPVSFPFATGQQPWSYDRPTTGRPAPDADPTQAGRSRWRDAPDRARYAFGHGLGYTRFELDDFLLPPGARPGMVRADVRVRNTGKRHGTDLIQIYARLRVADRVQPVRRLVAFRHVSIAPGATGRVTIDIDPAELTLAGCPADPDDARVDLWAARSSADPGIRRELTLPPATARACTLRRSGGSIG